MSEPKQSLTFDEICDAVPEIRELYRLAKMLGRRRGVDFCANAIWYSMMKPVVAFHVGFSRSGHRIYAEQNPVKAGTWPEPLDVTAILSEYEVRPASDENKLVIQKASLDPDAYIDRRLETPEAYDLVYETIYNALPDCNHKGSMCW